MCEDVLRLHALDLGSDELVRLAASPCPADQARFQTFLAVGWTSLAELPREMVLEGEGWPRLNSIADSLPHVKASEDALNAYVHPNYGSHIAALYPERAAAAHLLLTAILAVYDAFFKLLWAKRDLAGPAAALSEHPPWPEIVTQLRSRVLPEFKRSARNPALAQILQSGIVEQGLSEKESTPAIITDEGVLTQMLECLPRRASGVPGGTTARRACRSMSPAWRGPILKPSAPGNGAKSASAPRSCAISGSPRSGCARHGQ
jgi:hypothetical protein